MTKQKQKYGKPKMICPFCQERTKDGGFRAFAINGMSMHCRMNHPDRYDEYQTHRDKYIEKFACDDEGVLLQSGAAEQEPVIEDVIEEEVISEPEYEEYEEPPEPAVPDKQPTYIPPPPKPKPKPVEEPQTEEFPDDKKRDRYEYNPYGF